MAKLNKDKHVYTLCQDYEEVTGQVEWAPFAKIVAEDVIRMYIAEDDGVNYEPPEQIVAAQVKPPLKSSGASKPFFTATTYDGEYILSGTGADGFGFTTITTGGELIVSSMEPEHPMAKKVSKPDGSEGMNCVGCKEYYPHAEPNQENGTLKCYTCRTR